MLKRTKCQEKFSIEFQHVEIEDFFINEHMENLKK